MTPSVVFQLLQHHATDPLGVYKLIDSSPLLQIYMLTYIDSSSGFSVETLMLISIETSP